MTVNHLISTAAIPGTGRSRHRDRAALGDDRVSLRTSSGRNCVLLADGASGLGYGGLAADKMVETFDAADDTHFATNDGCREILMAADREVWTTTKGEGDTTGIVLVFDGGRYWGASAGDSRALHYSAAGKDEITVHQRRKPRIGSGAFPVGFEGRLTAGDVVVAASDGLWDFADPRAIDLLATSGASADDIRDGLHRLVLEENGGRLPDDLSIVVAVIL